MSTTAPTILRPEITLTLGAESVVVRDLPWTESLAFLKLLSSHAKDLLGAAGPDGKIDVAALIPKIEGLIGNVSELATFLLTKSTGKDAAWINGRSTLEVMQLLDAALEVNLSDGLIELGKKVGGRLSRVLAAKTNTTQA